MTSSPAVPCNCFQSSTSFEERAQNTTSTEWQRCMKLQKYDFMAEIYYKIRLNKLHCAHQIYDQSKI